MLELYIRTVDSLYFPALFAVGIPFVIFAAIAPLMGTRKDRPKPMPLAGTIMFGLSFWPVVLPLSIMALAFIIFLVLAAGSHKISDRYAQSEHFKRLVRRFHKQKV
jgi:hypothetical protein